MPTRPNLPTRIALTTLSGAASVLAFSVTGWGALTIAVVARRSIHSDAAPAVAAFWAVLMVVGVMGAVASYLAIAVGTFLIASAVWLRLGRQSQRNA